MARAIPLGLLRVAAELSGAHYSAVEAIAAQLLQLPDSATAVPKRSTLNNDRSPLQICVTARPLGRTVRLVGDPGTLATSTAERVAIQRRALEVLLGPGQQTTVSEMCLRILTSILPSSPERHPDAARGTLWLGAPLSGDGMAIYVKARWDGYPEDWKRCLSLTRQVFPYGSDVEAMIFALRDNAYPVSVGFETAGPKQMRLKLYWRLSRPVLLESMGVELLGDPSISDFLVRVLGARPVASTGLVFSTGFSLPTGQISDAKIDICTHCVPRLSQEWAELTESLATEHRLAEPGISVVLCTHRCELAFIGLGLDRYLEKRLNAYLKASDLM